MKFIIGLFVLALASLSFAQNSPRQEVEKVFRIWEIAIAKKDAKALAALMDKHGYTVSLDGTRWPFSRAEQDLGGWLKSLRKASESITIDSLSIQGDEAVAWITSVTRYEEKGSSGKPKVSISRAADTLRRINGKWQFVYSQDLPKS
jgi:ketosteroid isomerase-like protein